ncbi:hypothetical protein F0L68_12755 [Solihabitans fulvus]|uniref:Neutral zinc metallopeptidase n=1 Tax=Solihabitans fulvus TaxID=1892852 RepID=A0A5B2XHS0_9PSEU|nr:neutral zinc metallopeptidase [Solihabitans fulvus]KAA2262451.1 hypothetical protein F0L68_12755 [Solihabitans fulvus]
MQFNDDADLDTSQIEDARGSGGGGGGGGFGLGGGLALGGGGLGIIGLVLYLVLGHLGGGGGQGVSSGNSGGSDNSAISAECKKGSQANASQDCRVTAIVNSVQNYWTDQFARSGKTYKQAPTKLFSGRTPTACGTGTSGMGPFYCPGDSKVYIDLSFFQELQTKFGATDSPFVESYVLAHEYGHHVQNLLGTNKKVGTATGANSGSVRLELQADCYAGVWANHASTTVDKSGKKLIDKITQQDINNALDAASRIGDDYIQKNLGNGQVNQSQFTHGSSAQRQKWFTTGIQTGDPARCDTFGATDLG